MQISDKFSSSTTGELSVKNALGAMIFEGLKDYDLSQVPYAISVELPPVVGSSKRFDSGIQKQNVLKQSQGDSQLSSDLVILEKMVEHEDRITYRACLGEAGEVVALKCYADRAARDAEVAAYGRLRELGFVPKLQSITQFAEELRRPHALVVSWVGKQEGGNYMTLPTVVWPKVRKLVKQMHKAGVAHGDIRAQNMNYDFNTGELFIYDFSHATVQGSVEEEVFVEACADDLAEVDDNEKWSRTEDARKIYYFW